MNATFELSLFSHQELNRRGWVDSMLDLDRADFINQSEYGDGQTEGEFWVQCDQLAFDSEQSGRVFLVLVLGSFGNYNSPGASGYTTVYLYDLSAPDAVANYHEDVARLTSLPEYTAEVPSNDCECDLCDAGITSYSGSQLNDLPYEPAHSDERPMTDGRAD
jgi:hypothetical protein